MIQFLQEDVSYIPSNKEKLRNWLSEVALNLGYGIARLSCVFCSDEFLLKINKKYLNKEYYTDIITFPYENPDGLEGDLIISVERVKDNARSLELSFDQEIARVLVHGLLHLAGYEDEDDAGRQKMREKENFYLDWLLDSKAAQQ